MKPPISGRTRLAGVVGAPVTHSLSPIIHNAWLEAAGVDGAYVAFSPPPERFGVFLEGLRGGVLRGLNVTVPFKLDVLASADRRTARAERAGAANLLLFAPDGMIAADNTDGEGVLAAFAERAPGFAFGAGTVTILGAGGAARGAAMALLDAGAPAIRIVNRSQGKAEALCDLLGPAATAFAPDGPGVFDDAHAVLNATTLGLGGGPGPAVAWGRLPPSAVVMDMVYRPLETDFLREARARGHRVVDGLAMLIGQARPSFQAFFGAAPPASVDVRALAIAAMEGAR